MLKQTHNVTITKTLSFYKEKGIWFADLPAFLEAGLGTKANLMMVDGASANTEHLIIFAKVRTILFGSNK